MTTNTRMQMGRGPASRCQSGCRSLAPAECRKPPWRAAAPTAVWSISCHRSCQL